MAVFPLDLVLAGDGLLLSRPTDDDLDDLVRACRDPETVRFTLVPVDYDLEDARGYVEMCAEAARRGTALGLIARDGAGRLLASCGLVEVDHVERNGSLGYWVAPWARRQGVATRATRLVCRYAFEFGLERLHLEAATVNAGSNEVARRVGFRHEGTLRSAARERDPDRRGPGRPPPARLDMNVWGLLPDELR